MSESIEHRLRHLGIVLPPALKPMGNYVPFAITGDFLFLAGQVPLTAEGTCRVGKVGERVSIEEGYEHARLAGVRMLAAALAALGSLDRVERVVKLTGFVNSSPGFKDHPRVVNGCSDLLVQVFGEAGRHARSVVGVNSLPENFTVEIEGIFKFR